MGAQPTLERYVDTPELAELMGVSPSTIKRMRAAGMPSETWGMSRTRRYLPSRAMAWAAERRSRLDTDNPPERRANVLEHDRRRQHFDG